MRDLGNGEGRLTVDLDLSDIQSVNTDGLPTLSNEGMQTTATVRAGGNYLISALSRKDRSSEVAGPLKSKLAESSEDSVMQVWATVLRVMEPIANESQK
jgi:hypothetical protein